MNGTSNSEIITSSQVLYARDEKIYTLSQIMQNSLIEAQRSRGVRIGEKCVLKVMRTAHHNK